MGAVTNSFGILRSGLLAGLLLVTAAACTPAPDSAPDPVADPGQPQDTVPDPVDTEVVNDTDTTVPEGPLVRGRLLDPAQAPLAELPVRLCNLDGCYDTLTTSAGVFALASLPPGRYAASNPAVPGSSPAADALVWSPFFDYIDVPENGTLDWRDLPWIVPQVAERYVPAQGVQTMSFAGGALTVTFDADALVWPDVLAGANAPTIGAVEVPPSGWPRHGFGWAEHVRVFAFAPFDLETTDPNGFEVTMDIGDPVIPEGSGIVGFVAGWPDERPYSGFDRFEAKREGSTVTIRTPRLSWIIASVYSKEAP